MALEKLTHSRGGETLDFGPRDREPGAAKRSQLSL